MSLALLSATQLLLYVTCHGIGNEIVNFGITTDIENAGDSTITLTLNWYDTQYTCALSNTPFSTSTYYSCDGSSKSTITPISDNPYFMKIEYDSPNPLQIAMINVTDNIGSYYAVDAFCIPPGMQCTLDDVIFDEYTSSECNQWRSKSKYNKLAMGGDTKFILLYVDFAIFGTRFADTINEGGVRPPNLVDAGIYAGEDPFGESNVDIMVQWDISFLSCVIDADTPYQRHTCLDVNAAMTGPLFCPGMPSDFWISVHYDDHLGWQTVADIIATDETGRTYRFGSTGGKFCMQYGHWFDATPVGTSSEECDEHPGFYKPGTLLNGAVVVGNPIANIYLFPDHIPLFYPKCLFDYPDDNGANSEIVLALNGTHGGTGEFSPTYGWNPEMGLYGDPFNDASCPNTSAPTTDPTMDPTYHPASDPTLFDSVTSTSPTTSSTTATDVTTSNPVNGNEFIYVSQTLNYKAANRYCKDNYGTTLATIGDDVERQAAIDLIGNQQVWFGLYTKDGKQWRYKNKDECRNKNTFYKCIGFWGYRKNKNTKYRPRCIGDEEMGNACSYFDGEENIADNNIECDTALPFLCNKAIMT